MTNKKSNTTIIKSKKFNKSTKKIIIKRTKTMKIKMRTNEELRQGGII